MSAKSRREAREGNLRHQALLRSARAAGQPATLNQEREIRLLAERAGVTAEAERQIPHLTRFMARLYIDELRHLPPDWCDR